MTEVASAQNNADGPTERKSKYERKGQNADGWTTKGNNYFEAFYRGSVVPENEWESFLTAAKNPLPIAFRVTGFRDEAKAMLDIIKRDYLEKLETENKEDKADDKEEKAGICEFRQLPWYPDGMAFQLQMDRRTIRRTPVYQRFHEMLISETESGGISRQETVSMLPPLVLDVKPGHAVLDMCAAPGSKTAQLLEMLHADEQSAGMVLAETRGFVIANDNDAKRCQLMVHQLKRLQSPLLCVSCHDASTYPALKLSDGSNIQFDRVLCDVPCSGDGTIRKNPIIWKRWSLTQGAGMHKLQQRILRRGLEMLRSDGEGRLVYSTCSLNPAENEAVVAQVLMAGADALSIVDISNRLPGLKTRPGMTSWSFVTQEGVKMEKIEDVPPVLKKSFQPSIFCPENLDPKIAEQLKRCIRIMPHDNDTGGFFVAVFEKKGKLPWQKSMHPLALATERVEATENGSCSEQNEASEAKKPKFEAKKPMGNNNGKRGGGFRFVNEAPLIWLREDHDDWAQIKNFFKLDPLEGAADGTFIRANCLCSRTEGSRRRIFFLVSPRVRSLVQHNDHLRPICVGVRCFARSASANSVCDFRICQDCVHVLRPYVNSRVVELANTKDAIKLLSSEKGPYIGRLTSSVQKQLETVDVGTCIFRLAMDGFEISMAGWRGKATCRIFVAKYERSHFLRLCGIHSNDRKGKFAGERLDGKEASAESACGSDDECREDDVPEGLDDDNVKEGKPEEDMCNEVESEEN